MDRIKFLIEQYLNGELSLEEKLELDRWMDAADQNKEFFKELTDPAIMKSSVGKMDRFDRSRIWEKFQLGIRQFEEKPVKIEPVHLLTRNRLRYVAAAAVLIGISFGTYFLFLKKPARPEKSISALKKEDIAPGTNKAILTLGNGSKIILDSAANGLLAQQGNTKVVKTDSGKLSYNLLNEKPKETEPVYNVLTTPRGGQFQLTLPDGTKVWLNSASSISYPTAFAGNERKVTVTGEVYFEVVHNPKMPFRVKTGDLIIEDIGTAFNVNGYSDEPVQKTTLLEGSIKIKDQVLKPGQQLQMTGSKIRLVSGVDLGKVVAWKNGKISLANSSVEQIMREISRWYDVDVKYEGAIPDQKFYGIIDRNVPLSTVLLALKNYGVETKMEVKTIIVQ